MGHSETGGDCLTYSGETFYIEMGVDCVTQKMVYYELDRFSCSGFFGVPRYGKSALVKRIIVKAAKYGRPILIIEPYDEWSKIGQINKHARYPERVRGLSIVKDICFKISDFDDLYDWAVLGFSGRGLSLVHAISQLIEVHNNDPEIFLKLLEELPSKQDDLDRFNAKYSKFGFSLNGIVHSQEVNSIIQTILIFKRRNYFWYPEKEDGPDDPRIYVHDWGEFFKKNNRLVISMGIGRDDESKKVARLYAGLILRQIDIEYLKQIHPIIVVEEADMLIPKADYVPFCTSRDVLEQLALKDQRHWVHLIVITQSQFLMDPAFNRSMTQRIYGRMPFDENLSYVEKAKSLSRRTFIYYSKDSGKNYRMFKSMDCPCAC